MNVSKIKFFFFSNKKTLFYIGFFLFGFFLFNDVVFASGPSGTPTVSTTSENDAVGFLIDIAQALMQIAASILGVVTALVSLFLHPGWVNGTIIGLDEHMKQIWILISNIVYFIFAFILILIAFMNIIGKGDKWELKQSLPKFIVGVIMVPFTWFFVQFVLSMSAILTVSVLTLPYDTFQTGKFGDALAEIELCQSYDIDTGKKSSTDKGLGEFMTCTNSEKKPLKQLFNDPDGIFGLLSVYTYGVLNIESLDTIANSKVSEEGVISTIMHLGLKAIFDLIFVIVYLILMVALFLAVFVRGVWLWIYAMMSPAFGLLYFFGKTSEGVGDGDSKFSVKEFISLAMVPVYVSAAISFGLLFLVVAGTGLNNSDYIKSDNGRHTISVGFPELTIVAPKGGDNKDGTQINNALFGGTGSVISQIILQLFGIAILWIAVMTALKQSTITKTITEPIAKFGGSVGSLVAKSPMYAPIIPGGLSAQGLQRVATMPQQALETRVANNVAPHQENINQLFGTKTIGIQEERKFNEILDNKIDGASDFNQVTDTYKSWVAEFGRSNPKVQKLEQRLFEEMKKSNYVLSKNPALAGKDKIDSEFFYSITNRNPILAAKLENARNPGSISKDEVQSKSKNIVGDFSGEEIDVVDMTQGDKVSDRIRFVKDKSAGYGKGFIVVKDHNSDAGDKYEINLQIKKDAKDVKGDNLKELKSLYSKLDGNKEEFESILKSLGFENVNDLLKVVEEASDD